MNVKIYNQSGKDAGTVELPDSVFGLPWNADLIHQVVVSQMANQRQGSAHAKGRGEVRGGGRKPWRQKGTGRARHGSIRSPLWKGGGVTHGPLKERNFKKAINKKMATKALAVVLSAKFRDHEVLVVDGVNFGSPKTKEAASVVNNFSKVKGYERFLSRSALVAISEYDPKVIRAYRNLPSVRLEEAKNITALDVLSNQYLVLPKESIAVLEKRLSTTVREASEKR